MSSSSLARLLKEKRVLVCCGAGGVGKTTVSASLALGAAQAGLRVVVITIDPSRRLAETLGVSPNQDAPTALSADRLASVGVSKQDEGQPDDDQRRDHRPHRHRVSKIDERSQAIVA